MSSREVVIRFPKAPEPDEVWTRPTDEPAVTVSSETTDDALAMVRFLLARLGEDRAHMARQRMPRRDRLRLARHLGGQVGMANEWTRLVMANPDPSPEVEGWRRGLASGLLIGLCAAAYAYADHPDWDPEWTP